MPRTDSERDKDRIVLRLNPEDRRRYDAIHKHLSADAWEPITQADVIRFALLVATRHVTEKAGR